MTSAPRRVVTGHDESGNSVVLSDGPPPVQVHVEAANVSFFELWNTNAAPEPISATEPDPTERPLEVAPRARGTIVRVNELRPGAESPMHRTETIDYGFVLEGEVVLVLTDSEVQLRAGDMVVQRGTDHKWENRSDTTARMAFVLVDGTFSPELEQLLGPEALAHVMRGPP